MLVVGLDESGRFESLTSHGDRCCTFIAGPVFRCNSTQDIKRELTRLESFFKRVCSDQQATYPADLHFNRNAEGSIINAGAASRVKKQLAEELPAFMQGIGCWAAEKPYGTYGLYAMVSDRFGMSQGIDSPAGNLTDDNTASNRYEHMAYRTLENLLFYNHKLAKESSLRLDLATRVMGVGQSAELREDAKKLGFAQRRTTDGSFDNSTVIVTDETSYRAMLSSAAERAGRTDVQCELNIWSISYKSPQFQQGFLYLADTICSVFQDIIGGISEVGAALSALSDYCKQTTGKQMTMLWAYHPIDRELRIALESEKHLDYFSALLTTQSALKGKGPLRDVYDDLWFSAILRRITMAEDCLQLQIALQKLDNYIHDSRNSTRSAIAIADTLKKALGKVKPAAGQEKLYFRMAIIEMTLYNHLGDSEAAKECYLRCVAYAQSTSIEEFLGVQNMYSVALLDSFRTDEAMEIAQAAVNYHEMLNDIRKEIYTSHPDIFVSYGRALSQLGQCYAFSVEYDEAIAAFQRALPHFINESRDRLRTVTYLLHAAIEMGDIELFESFSKIGFGYDSILALWKTQHRIPDEWDKYLIYVFVKAMYVLYRDQLAKKEIITMINILRKRYLDKRDNHPWELIMKYCALLTAYAGGNTDTIDWFDHEIDTSVSDLRDGILPRILREAHEQIREAKSHRFDLVQGHLPYMYR